MIHQTIPIKRFAIEASLSEPYTYVVSGAVVYAKEKQQKTELQHTAAVLVWWFVHKQTR